MFINNSSQTDDEQVSRGVRVGRGEPLLSKLDASEQVTKVYTGKFPLQYFSIKGNMRSLQEQGQAEDVRWMGNFEDMGN
ncbi:hypothetical protein NPIL_145631 [Nephila pilipes]|uniref:Uncharacterized protein n=1 Tax=Nephila pilipes TaxID=299642 RepID=A0A8X6MCJ3_NEPPI|nr:hypothetical protein NPIL_145631 [Nephila pilipes]